MSRFTDAVEHYCKGLHVSPGVAVPACQECCDAYSIDPDDWDEDSEQPLDEGSFSRSSCDSCGSSLAGNRYVAHGINKDNEIVHLDICEDCLMFHANGDEPTTGEWIRPDDPDEDDEDESCANGHDFGPVEHARLTGNPHRKCKRCGLITLDLEDNDGEEPTETA